MIQFLPEFVSERFAIVLLACRANGSYLEPIAPKRDLTVNDADRHERPHFVNLGGRFVLEGEGAGLGKEKGNPLPLRKLPREPSTRKEFVTQTGYRERQKDKGAAQTYVAPTYHEVVLINGQMHCDNGTC